MKKSVLVLLFALCFSLTLSPFARATGDVYVPPTDVDVNEDYTPSVDLEYMYDSIDPDGNVMLRTDLLSSVVSMQTALNAVRQQIQGMDAEDR